MYQKLKHCRHRSVRTRIVATFINSYTLNAEFLILSDVFCHSVQLFRSLIRELALSGRKMLAKEAFQHGLVSRSFDTKETMMAEALSLAKAIASKSPIATLGIKEFLNYTRDHSVPESLEYAITWNMSMLQGADLATATASMVQKSVPEYENLPATKQSKL